VRATFLTLLMLAQPALATEVRKPAWDCSIEMREGQDTWQADNFAVRWHRFTANRAYFSVDVTIYDPAFREALHRFGPFDPALQGSLSVGPHIARATKPLWVSIASGSRALAPVLVSRHKGFYGSASVSLLMLEPLLEAGPELRIIFYLADGTILNQTALSVRDVRAAIEHFPSLSREYATRLAKPEGVCIDRSEDIVIVD
jgi:hypothetical protein